MSGELTTIDQYCQLGKTSLSFKRDVTKDEWMKVFQSLKTVEGCVQFWIGDCLAYRQQKWGMYDDVLSEIGKDKKGTIQNIVSVSRAVESSRRREDLSFKHHTEVASLSPGRQEYYLKKASEEKLTARDLREEIRKDKVRVSESGIIPQGKFQVFYADPPWKYGNSMPEYFTEQANYYPLMTIDEICDMSIKNIIDENAVLFLWVTSPILEESFQVINAWGFEYKTSFVWDKIKHNMGHYNSVRHEFLLLCIRGSYPIQEKKLFDSVISIERTEHSKKPDEFYEIIETLYPNSKKIELFSRQERKGWDSYGNQISRSK
jgi:N6-adenosine-specific RNA methylase IME4